MEGQGAKDKGWKVSSFKQQQRQQQQRQQQQQQQQQAAHGLVLCALQ